MKHTSRHLLFLLVIPFVFGGCKPHSQVTEYSEAMITYPFSDFSPFPILNRRNDIYP